MLSSPLSLAFWRGVSSSSLHKLSQCFHIHFYWLYGFLWLDYMDVHLPPYSEKNAKCFLSLFTGFMKRSFFKSTNAFMSHVIVFMVRHFHVFLTWTIACLFILYKFHNAIMSIFTGFMYRSFLKLITWISVCSISK